MRCCRSNCARSFCSNSLSISFGPGKRVSAIGYGLKAVPDKGWPLIAGLFTLKSITGALDINEPFRDSRNTVMTLGGTLEIPTRGRPLQLTAEVKYPVKVAAANGKPAATTHSVTARLAKGATLDLPDLIGGVLPGIANVLPLTFSTLDVSMVVGQPDYRIKATSTQSKSVAFGGSKAVQLGKFALDLARGADNKPAGVVSATLTAFGRDLSVSYNVRGGVGFSAHLPDFKPDLDGLVTELMGNLSSLGLPLPAFPIWLPKVSLSNSVISLVQKADSTGSLAVRAELDGVGLLAFEAIKGTTGSGSGFVAAIDISPAKLSRIPGLSALDGIDLLVSLDELMVMISSAPLDSYSFPEASRFDDPLLNLPVPASLAKTLTLPRHADRMAKAGLRIYARWTPDPDARMQKLLFQLLKRDGGGGADVSMAMTLEVTDPARDAKLFTSFGGTLCGYPLNGTIGVMVRNGQPGLYAAGTMKPRIQGNELTFQVELLIVSTGAVITGSMVGTVSFAGLTLTNLALVIGANWSGVPAFGFSCMLTVGSSLHSALALLYDSTDSSRSLVAGSISDFKLRDVLNLIPHVDVPPLVGDILPDIELLHFSDDEFYIDAALAADLDRRDPATLSLAFKDHKVVLPATANEALLVVATLGESWSLTDLAHNMRHYQLDLDRKKNQIRVRLNPQFYCVPNDSSIGPFKFKQGFFIAFRLKFYKWEAEAKATIDINSGIAVDGRMDPIVIYDKDLFSVTSADDTSKGARVSLATYGRDDLKFQLPAAERAPHFLLDGQVTVLGFGERTTITISKSGFAFRVIGSVARVGKLDLTGNFTKTDYLSISGTLRISLGSINAGWLGSVDVGEISAGLEIKYESGKPTARVEKTSFRALGVGLSIPGFDITIGDGFAKIPEKAANQAKDAILAHFGDVLGKAIKAFEDAAGFVTHTIVKQLKEIEPTVEGVRSARTGPQQIKAKDAFPWLTSKGKTPFEALTILWRAGYTPAEIIDAVQSGFDVITAARLLRSAGYRATDIADVFRPRGSVGFLRGDKQAAMRIAAGGYPAREAVAAMRAAFALADEQLVVDLVEAGYAVADVAPALNTRKKEDMARLLQDLGYLSGDAATVLTLRALGFPPNDIAKGLARDFGKTATAAAGSLKGAGYSLRDVASWVISAFSLSRPAVLVALKDAGCTADEIVDVVKSFDVPADDKVALLKGAGYLRGDAATIPILKALGYPPEKIAVRLVYSFNKTVAESAVLLKAAGYDTAAIFSALSTASWANSADVVDALRLAGAPAGELYDLLKPGSPENRLRVLADAGYPLGEVVTVIDALKLSRDEKARLLRTVAPPQSDVPTVLALKTFGYPSNEIVAKLAEDFHENSRRDRGAAEGGGLPGG